MANQEEFDAQIARANTSLDGIATAIAAEAAQIQAFIDAHPSTDTSALEGVVTRLETVGTSVGGIFTPPEVTAAPADTNS